MRVEADLAERGVREVDGIALVDPRGSGLRPRDVDFVQAAGGDVRAEAAHDVLLLDALDQAAVPLVGNEIAAVGSDALGHHVGDVTEIRADGVKHRLLVLVGGAARLRPLIYAVIHNGSVHNRIRRGLREFRFQTALTLKALDVLAVGHHIRLHLVVGGGVLCGELAVLVGALVEEGLGGVPELGALIDEFLNLVCHE